MVFHKKYDILLNLLLIMILLMGIAYTNSQLLNNIIRLADNPYRYNHISFNAEGDMVLDIESYPVTKVRKFYGIKKNGAEFFTDNSGSKTHYYSMELSLNGRVEGESCFIKIHSIVQGFVGKEFLCGVSKSESNTYKIEFYEFIDGYSYTLSTNNYFGELTANVFTLIPDPLNTESEFNYFISYIGTPDSYRNFKLYTKKLNFYLNNLSNGGINVESLDNADAITQKIISCFFTDNYFYICFYTKKESKLTISVFDPKSKIAQRNEIHTFNEQYERRFYKGIHLKGEIGFFAYFKDKGSIPTFSLYQIQSDKNIQVYKSYSNIQATQGTFYNIDMLCDLIKLNNNTVCFLSSNSEKTGLNILVFSFYNDDNYMNIRYFFINIWQENTIKFFCELRLNLFNNFIVMAFSNCIQEVCEESQYENYEHFSSLIIFNYPNINNKALDIIEYIYESNKNIENEIKINFEDFLLVENNIFGYILKGIKILSYSDEINLLVDGNIVEPESIIEASENIILKFKSDGFFTKGHYNIELAFVVTEPDYGTNNNYMIYIDDTRGNNINNEEEYFRKNEYIGKDSNLKVILSNDLTNNCNNDICSLCYEENKDNCVTCKYNFDFNQENKIKTCFNLETEAVEKIPTTIINFITEEIDPLPTTIQNQEGPQILETTEKLETTNKIIITEINTIENRDKNINSSSCKEDKILSGKCSSKISNEQLKNIYDYIKHNITANTGQIISTENVIFQISPLSEQKDNDNPNISSIDLGECENILKNNSNLTDDDDLIIFKIDIKNEDLSMTYVQYEIYNPQTSQIMSLDVCEDVSITVNVPVNLDESTQSIYNRLSKSGYNLFDLEDDFYNDICSTYTTENGTDLTLVDRKNIIYDTNGNLTMCQEGCTFESYNLTTKKSQCDCAIQTSETITNIDDINFEHTSLVDEFFHTLNNSNFRVLKCFKLAFSKIGQKNNFGSYLMSGFCIIFIALLLFYIIKENSKITRMIKQILKNKVESSKEQENQSNLNNSLKTFKKNTKITDIIKSKTEKTNKKKSKFQNNKNKPKESEEKEKDIDKKEKINKKKIRFKSEGLFPPKRKKLKPSSKSLINKSNKTNDDTKTEKILVTSKKERIKNINIINIKTESKPKIDKINIKNTKLKNKEDYLKEYKMIDINDQQLNDLEYEIALIIDKRTYFQYYFSLLKKKHLILIAFYPNNDYNLRSIKISLLILSFSLYFTVNGFFFSDETMNKINKDHGKYDFLYQIPQILYSTIISAVINIILKWLSLSEKQILDIKTEKNYINAKKIYKSKIKCLRIKLGIFFGLSLLLMLFFWYFISCFCAVYKNTQKILILDTIISFILSMIYPFALNLLPGLFRIPALKEKQKNKKYLYILSGYVALI